jgi:hypothetical protein
VIIFKGRSKLERYTGKDNYGKPKSEYLKKIAAMTEDQLLKETESKIWLSAYAANNPRSDFHWQCDATYDEWVKRGKVDQYNITYKKVMRSEGYE